MKSMMMMIIVERLGKIFKDMPPYTPCPVPDLQHVLQARSVVMTKAAKY
jgi:hypothetical protein